VVVAPITDHWRWLHVVDEHVASGMPPDCFHDEASGELGMYLD
jgi:hypothetical protein